MHFFQILACARETSLDSFYEYLQDSLNLLTNPHLFKFKHDDHLTRSKSIPGLRMTTSMLQVTNADTALASSLIDWILKASSALATASPIGSCFKVDVLRVCVPKQRSGKTYSSTKDVLTLLIQRICARKID